MHNTNVVNMSLSTAIRLGSMLGPQGFFRRRHYVDSETIATCAVGAAEAAIDGNVFIVFPILLSPFTTCCKDGYSAGDVYAHISHLNDHHRWTREHIADWVERIENAQELTTITTTTELAEVPA